MTSWAAHELQTATFNDRRLTRRLIRLVDDLSAHPSTSLPAACGTWAATKGAARFLDSDRGTPDAIRMAHRDQTLRRIPPHSTILVIQDTTEFDFTSHPATTGLGYLACPTHRGLRVHSVLAATIAGVPLGLLHQAVWTRDPALLETQRDRARPQAERESQRWLDGMITVADILPPDVHAIIVADREADLYALFAAHRPSHVDLLVRAAYNRSVDADTRLLDAAIATCPVGGTVTLEVPRRPQQPPRTATLTVRWLTVRFDPPKNMRQRATLPRPPVQVVVVEEQHPPSGVPALRWVLLTTVPVTTFEEALEIVRWYRTRWLIERYHFVLKSGCGVERLQWETAARLERALAVYCIVAWRLLWLTYEARQSPAEPCTLVLAPHEWQALYCTMHQTPIPIDTPPTLQQAVFWIAQLGGFLGRKSDGEPGAKVIWRGLRRVEDIVATWVLLNGPTPCQRDGSLMGND